MPKKKLQNFIFTLMMTIVMAYIMIIYSIGINLPEGLVNKIFLITLKKFPLDELIAFICAYFIESPLAKKLAFRFTTQGKNYVMFTILSIQLMIVLIIVGLMSFYALFAMAFNY